MEGCVRPTGHVACPGCPSRRVWFLVGLGGLDCFKSGLWPFVPSAASALGWTRNVDSHCGDRPRA
eukprot:364609-Chlamydomonas_euryale.AAC.4